MKWKR